MPGSQATALVTQQYKVLLASLGRRLVTSLPSAVKCLLWLLIIVNAKSLPFLWHLRVFRPVISIRVRARLLQLKNLLTFKSRKESERIMRDWLESQLAVGLNPFGLTETYTSFASIDDSDYNGHLSNSSYAKTQDAGRLKVAMRFFLNFFRGGGWMALAGTHYHFIKEIPMLSKYELRAGVAAWDNKWMYMYCRFVTKSNSGKKSKKSITNNTSSPNTDTDTFTATLRQPTSTTEISTPNIQPSSSSSNSIEPELTAQLLQSLKTFSGGRSEKEEKEDGATLHCISISQLCFKVGRITVPPAIALVMNGFCSSSSRLTGSSTPDYWPRIQALKDPKAMNAFMKGGWKDLPSEDRFWEKALGGEVEEMRVRNLAIMEKLRFGLEGARTM